MTARTACAWWLFGADLRLQRQGHGAPAQWPRAQATVALLDSAEISWHRLKLPRVARARWPQALAGALEEQLLDEAGNARFAVSAGAQPGALSWVAAFDGPWVQTQLRAMADAGAAPSRLVPLAWPTAAGREGHIDRADDTGEGAVRCTLRNTDGVICVPLSAAALPDWVRALRDAGTTGDEPPVRWSAAPAAVQAAERALGHPVAVVALPEQVAAALGAPWDLLQFDLSPRLGARRALAQLAQQVRAPRWRVLRWGGVSLAVVQALGLSLAAWQLERDLVQRRAQQAALLRESFPAVKVVVDAPLQMRREVQRLREIAGVPDDDGFERALETAAALWPEGQPPASQIEFERGRLSLGVVGWTEAQRSAFLLGLRGTGWAAQAQGDRLVLARAAAAPVAPR